MRDHKPDIELHGPFQATDKKGLFWNVTRLSINAEGYIPDVRIDLDSSYEGEALYDDAVFIGQVMDKLRSIGFSGEPFDRAELGMQGRDYLMLEPSKDFREFALTRGWVDLSKVEGLPWGEHQRKRGDEHQRLEEHTYVFRVAPRSDEKFPEEQDYKAYSKWVDAFEKALDDNVRKIPGWHFVDHDDIECEAFELCQLETEFAEEGPRGFYKYLELQIPIRRSAGNTLTPSEVRQMAEALTPFLQSAGDALEFDVHLHEVRVYRSVEFSVTAVMFRQG